MTDISVVLCTYNGERFIEEQLRSILDQTRPAAEIVVGDDGSTDRTLEIVESVAATTATPVRVHRNERRLGYADNFLQTCERVRHPYIAFSDQDDRWAPTKLETAHAALVHADAALCVHAVDTMDEEGVVTGDNRSRRTRTRVVPPLQADPFGNYYGFTMLFSRSLLEKLPVQARGTDSHTPHTALPHDRWIFFLASTFGRTVVLDACLAAYRQHGAQLYGRETGRTVAQRIVTKLATGGTQARYLAEVAAYRAALLEAPPRAGDEGPWQAGAAHWRTIASHLDRRAALYDDTTTLARTGLLTSNVRHGVYRTFAKGGLGPRRFVEDLVVVAATAVRRPSTVAR